MSPTQIISAYARLLMFMLAAFIIPGGAPYGLIDH